MARRINVKLIIQLHDAGISRNKICQTRNISRNSASDVIRIADEKGITWNDIKDLSDEQAYQLFYPDKHQYETIYEVPDYGIVHEELSKTGVTLKLLWKEYQDKCRKENKTPIGYSSFCDGYNKYTVRLDLTKHLDHKPGERCEVDWSGTTMHYADQTTGEIIKVNLFVATLPYSQYTYVEPTLDMKMDTWIRCNVNMFDFFGGVTRRIVCDNLKTGVVSHPHEGDVLLTKDYEAFGTHYVTAIMPAGVRKPKQKPSVEGNVGKIATAIIAELRNTTFRSFEELKAAVREKLNAYNEKAFNKREGSRKLVHEEEKKYLRPLPDIPYEIAEWVKHRKIGLDFHAIYKKNRYSVPYQYAKQYCDLKVTDHYIEIYVKDKRVAIHNRFPEYVHNAYSTKEEHMPPEFLKQEWDKDRICRWADSIGPSARSVVNRIFEQYQIKEQGYNPTLSVLRLSKTYSQERLETACELALTKYRVPRYKHLKALLSANQDKIYQNQKSAGSKSKDEENSMSGYLRGSDYYGGEHD